MTYIGEVHNGVVVLKDAPPLEEGTEVRVEVSAASSQARRGSATALLRHAGVWADSASEMKEALEYLRKTKWDDVHRQQAEAEPTL